MIICKNLNQSEPIITIDDWKRLCPPQKKDEHWKDGRSAKETAKHWINGAPIEFQKMFNPIGLQIEFVSPEKITNFDNLGEGRHHDIVITGKIQGDEKVAICIESKVDEPFGTELVGEYNVSSKANNPNSKVPERIELLKKALFTKNNSINIDRLGYQLLTAIAGTLAESKNTDCKKVYFIVQTFLSYEMSSKSHRNNERALDFFIEVISNGRFKIIHDGDLLQIGTVPGNEFIPNDVELYIGKYSIRL